MHNYILELLETRDATTGTRIPLEGDCWLIGRGPGADIQLPHSSVSRQHAEMRRSPFGCFAIHDRSSTNGTYVNGSRIESTIVEPGDEIMLGRFTLRLHAPHQTDEWLPRRHISGRARCHADEERQRFCDWLVREHDACDALVVRLTDAGAVHLLAGHLGVGRSREPLSRSVLSELWRRRELVMRVPSPTPLRPEHRPSSPNWAGPVVAFPLVEHAATIEAVYIELRSPRSIAEWHRRAPSIAKTYERSQLVGQVQDRVYATALVERELETARVLQHRWIPRDLSFDGLEVMTGYHPRLAVGGDYIDAIERPDGVLLVIADASGKGMKGALIGSCLHTLLHSAEPSREALHQTIERINDYLCRFLPDDSFVTLLAALLDPQTGRIEYVNAGHPPALLARRDGVVRQLESGRNLPLGIMPTEFEAHQAELADDEVMILFTDGFTELPGRDRGLLGLERFRKGIASIVATPGRDPLRTLEAELHSLIDAHRKAAVATDDAAFLLASRTPIARRESTTYSPALELAG